jgi:hypothetical protein
MWAQCARDAGYSFIEDPLGEYVLIPEDVTLADAEKLGRACSEPMVDDEYHPVFDVRGGVPVEVDGETFIQGDSHHIALGGPFLDKEREENPEEFVD